MYEESSSASSRVQPRKLFGYVIGEMIGEGAGSSIYIATDPNTRQKFAFKHVVRTKDKDLRFVEQLQAEYEVGSKVTHSGLRRSVDYRVSRSLLFKVTEAALVMELFPGRPLEFQLPDSLGGIVDVFIQTANALDALHQMGYVHCDLKPNNILVSASNEVKVIDLGQACPIGTQKKRIQGTPDFIAPEQVKCSPITTRTDVYNFGATFYWALTQRKLPTLYTVKKTNGFLLDAAVPTPADLNESVPQPLSNLVMECVRTNPSKRPADMTEIAHRLEIIRHGLSLRSGAHQQSVA